MPDRDIELQELWLAHRHIAQAEQLIAEQEMVLERLQRNGSGTELARQTLAALRDSLQNMLDHRRLIEKTLAQIDQGLFTPPGQAENTLRSIEDTRAKHCEQPGTRALG